MPKTTTTTMMMMMMMMMMESRKLLKNFDVDGEPSKRFTKAEVTCIFFVLICFWFFLYLVITNTYY